MTCSEKTNKIMNDKGFTLVEVIVVIGIMAIISSIGIVGISAMMNTNVNSASDTLVSVWNKAQTDGMSHKENTSVMRIYYVKENCYATVVNNIDPNSAAPWDTYETSSERRLGNVEIRIKSTAGIQQLAYTDSCYIKFDKATGKVKDVIMTGYPFNPDSDTLDSIEVFNNNKTVNLTIGTNNGKAYK